MRELEGSATARAEMDNRLAYLHATLSKPVGPDTGLDASLELVLTGMGIRTAYLEDPRQSIPAYTASLDAARRFV